MSVQGGLEMGQGLHTKMIQVAAQCLAIDMSLIHIAETSTNIVPNAMPTAGSISTDLNGMAVLDACKTLSPIQAQQQHRQQQQQQHQH